MPVMTRSPCSGEETEKAEARQYWAAAIEYMFCGGGWESALA
jgi:hypothetical protein